VSTPRGYRVARATAPNGKKGWVAITPYEWFVLAGDDFTPVYESANAGFLFASRLIAEKFSWGHYGLALGKRGLPQK